MLAGTKILQISIYSKGETVGIGRKLLTSYSTLTTPMGNTVSKTGTPMRLLELFSGTGSVGKVAQQHGFVVTSVDINRKANPTFRKDIMRWKYKEFPPGYFDMIWASPPCNTFSHMQYGLIGRPSKEYNGQIFTRELMIAQQEEYGVPILNKVKEIIEYFQPGNYFIENPKTGRMKDYMHEYKYTDVCYCMYGFDYKKPTRIWHNNEEFIDEGYMCNHTGRHARAIGNSNSKGVNTLNERYSIPPALVESVFRCVPCADVA